MIMAVMAAIGPASAGPKVVRRNDFEKALESYQSGGEREYYSAIEQAAWKCAVNFMLHHGGLLTEGETGGKCGPFYGVNQTNVTPLWDKSFFDALSGACNQYPQAVYWTLFPVADSLSAVTPERQELALAYIAKWIGAVADPDERKMILTLVGESTLAKAEPLLAEAIAQEAADGQESIAVRFQAQATSDPGSIALGKELAMSRSAGARAYAAQGLVCLASQSPEVLPALEQLLRDPEKEVRLSVLTSMRAVADVHPFSPLLPKVFVAGDNLDVKEGILLLVARADSADIARSLLSFVGSTDPDNIRSAAALCSYLIGDETLTVPVMEYMRSGDPMPWVLTCLSPEILSDSTVLAVLPEVLQRLGTTGHRLRAILNLLSATQGIPHVPVPDARMNDVMRSVTDTGVVDSLSDLLTNLPADATRVSLFRTWLWAAALQYVGGERSYLLRAEASRIAGYSPDFFELMPLFLDQYRRAFEGPHAGSHGLPDLRFLLFWLRGVAASGQDTGPLVKSMVVLLNAPFMRSSGDDLVLVGSLARIEGKEVLNEFRKIMNGGDWRLKEALVETLVGGARRGKAVPEEFFDLALKTPDRSVPLLTLNQSWAAAALPRLESALTGFVDDREVPYYIANMGAITAPGIDEVLNDIFEKRVAGLGEDARLAAAGALAERGDKNSIDFLLESFHKLSANALWQVPPNAFGQMLVPERLPSFLAAVKTMPYAPVLFGDTDLLSRTYPEETDLLAIYWLSLKIVSACQYQLHKSTGGTYGLGTDMEPYYGRIGVP